MEGFTDINDEVVDLNTPSSNTEGEINYNEGNDIPIINIKEKVLKISTNEKFDYIDNATASDIQDGDLTSSITTNISDLDFTKEGIKRLEYTVVDSSGNVAKETVFVTVVKDNTNLVRFAQLSIFVIILLVILFLVKYMKSIKFEKRFSKYTINSSKNNSISLFDNLYTKYNNFINRMGKFLSKSDFINKKSKRYDKYVISFNIASTTDFVSRKIFVGFIFIVVATLVKLSESQVLQLYEMIIPFIIGFYTLDLVYAYKYSMYRKKIEDDMLGAITIMNNAFKSGMSIIQAIELVSKEIRGPIATEFCKIKQELLLGLDIEIAFKRFSDRIKVNEAVYLTSSLSVLNKSGGNIIKVFDSIEKNLYNRKKLQNELKSLTSSSRLVTYVLIFIPIVFISFFGIVNRTYFSPLFTNPIGIVIIFIMLIIYVTYIITVRHFMRVRM